MTEVAEGASDEFFDDVFGGVCAATSICHWTAGCYRTLVFNEDGTWINDSDTY